MDLVDVQLNHYCYRFRRLTYREEFALSAQGDDDVQKVVLAAALTEVSGLPIAGVTEALEVMGTIPARVRDRIWVLYRAGIKENRFFTTQRLYRAPERSTLEKIQEVTDEQRAQVADKAIARMEEKFGKAEVAEAMETERSIIADAKRRGRLRPATPEQVKDHAKEG